MKIAYNRIGTKKTINYVIFGLIFILFSLSAKAQETPENPPIPIQVQVNTSQSLNFGAFTVGSGTGSVTINSNGSRSNTGDTYLLNMGATPSAALFDVTANPGTIIQIQPESSINLVGSKGGSITLNIDSYSTGQTFITTAIPPSINSVYVGGTLSSGGSSANPPGQYNGSFTLTFIQQ
jgi:hypothetical protein